MKTRPEINKVDLVQLRAAVRVADQHLHCNAPLCSDEEKMLVFLDAKNRYARLTAKLDALLRWLRDGGKA